MAPHLFSRLGPPGQTTRSFYEQLQAEDELDVESGEGLALDEENLRHQFHDDDLENTDGLAIEDSRMSTASTFPVTRQDRSRPSKEGKHITGAKWLAQDDDGDNDVPASLLVEEQLPHATRQPTHLPPPRSFRQQAIPGSVSRTSQAQWATTQTQQRLHHEEVTRPARNMLRPNGAVRGFGLGSPKEKAMWRWANVTNLDAFAKDVYDYFLGAGVWCILLERMLHLVKGMFVTVLLTFVTQCVDYSKLRGSKSLSQVTIPQCTKNMWGIWNVGVWLYSFYFIFKAIQFLLDLPRLFHIRDFYIHLLDIPEEDMQTVSWQDVVCKIAALRDSNVSTAAHMTPSQKKYLTKELGRNLGSQSKEKLDAHDIANRLMRRENYVIALINKEILDLRPPIPFLRNRQLYSKTLEWNLSFSMLDFVFNDQGQVRQAFLKSKQRGQLSQKLRYRFIFAAVMSLVFAPFLACYLVIDFVLTYYNEFKTDKSAVGVRQYTPLAEWKFREFNELPHLFRERLNMSYPFAKHYIDQFPKKKTEVAASTVSFFAGALIAVLAIAGFSDPELFVDFDIAPGLNAFALLAILGTTWAVARGMISEETDVFDPEYALRNVINYTHYEPDQWKGRLHSYDVKSDFSEMYKMKILIFVEEIVSILLTPIILFYSLPRCSDQIVDFFREFTVHIDGLGYVCSFAVFDFQKDTQITRPQQSGPVDAREDYYATKHGKMQASFYGFLDNYYNNPKTGLPGLRQGAQRSQFHPPPAFPGLNSPSLVADMRGSRMGHGDRVRNRAPQGTPAARQVTRSRPPVAPSPMASMLLDPHHQPSSSLLATRSIHGARGPRGTHPGDAGIIEETLEDDSSLPRQSKAYVHDGVEDSMARLDESTWEGSPRHPLSRENSGAATEGEESTGVVMMLRQFQQAHMNHRVGGVL